MRLQNTISPGVFMLVADDDGFIIMTKAEIERLYRIVFEKQVPEGMSPGEIIQAIDDLRGQLPQTMEE